MCATTPRRWAGPPPAVADIVVSKQGSKGLVVTWTPVVRDCVAVTDCYEVEVRSLDTTIGGPTGGATPGGVTTTSTAASAAAGLATPSQSTSKTPSFMASKNPFLRETPLASSRSGFHANGLTSPGGGSASLLESPQGIVAIKRTFIRRNCVCHLRPLDPGRRYTVTVRAHNLCGWGPPTAPFITMTTRTSELLVP